MADLSITAANVVLVSGTAHHGTAGATITAGQALYSDATDSGKLKLADANDSAQATVVGIALHGASNGQPLAYCALEPGDVINLGATLGVGKVYVLSGTAGGIMPVDDITAAGNVYVTVLGVGKTASNLQAGLNVSGVIAAADVT